MNKVVLQLWEESDIEKGNIVDGCSLHINIIERNKYINCVYNNIKHLIPDTYDRIIGNCVNVYVEDDIYKSICEEKSIKLSQV